MNVWDDLEGALSVWEGDLGVCLPHLAEQAIAHGRSLEAELTRLRALLGRARECIKDSSEAWEAQITAEYIRAGKLADAQKSINESGVLRRARKLLAELAKEGI